MQISTENCSQFTCLTQRHFFLKYDHKIAGIQSPKLSNLAGGLSIFFKKLAQPQKKYKLMWNITALVFSWKLKKKKKRKTIDHKRKQCFAFLVKPSSVPVSVAKDLGIYIDQSLTYDYHITKTVSTCLQKLIQIKRIKHLIDKSTLLLLLVSSLVFSELYYCSSIWSNTSKRNIKKLQLIQNFVKRTQPFP